ncbi:MAG: UDP-3-O-(3-hydroxymyristoyl)glucosamine N-acyltransferase [Bacteroidetes bacterium]|nr:MAG: UDP-3-O-(3-hydroxymyristoyl)glucosamine N-acyltransferase [Bacteroidota bacterium]PTM10337.1 MAG: UDP-3-O-(3-hydroxymyristoyl)glucosamine N-acyltransferase [Bacteroidota bacterium]
MEITAQQLFDACKENAGLLAIEGNTSAKIMAIAPFQSCKPGDLVFAPDAKALSSAIAQGAAAVVVHKAMAQAAAEQSTDIGILLSANIGYSHAKIKQQYGDHNYARAGWDRIHASAIIHPSVNIPVDTVIGPNVVIEQGAQIGAACHIMANVVIEHDAIIGHRVRIHPSTIIGWECILGDDCLVLSNTVIGGEGFGYAQDQYFNHHRIPQTGNVVIGNKVTIGANCTIDRGTYGPTTIGDGCIFDNLCHVAHNVTIGNNCIALSGFLCAGSTVIGNRVVASGGAMIKDHVNICDDVYLMHRAGVVKDIKQAGMYAGGPVLPMKEYVVSNAIYGKLGELRQQVMDLGKRMKEKLGE